VANVTDFTRRTLRTWAVAQAVYAVVLAILVVVYVPWKTPVANGLALVYVALHGVGALGLFRQRRWGHRLSLIAGLVGLAAAVVVCGALVASWAYLRAVFGDFGRGASITALLLASVALQLLGLFPALQLRALLRREVRADMRGGGALRGLVGAMVALPLLVASAVHGHYAHNPVASLSTGARDAAHASLLASLRQEDAPEQGVLALEGLPVGPGPLYATVWHRGRVAARIEGTGEDLAEAVRDAGEQLRGLPSLDRAARRAGRLRVDRVVATSPVLAEWGPVLALSVNPGRDGLRRCNDERCEVVLPDDLLKAQRYGAAPLVPGIRELRLGLDGAPVLATLEVEGGGPLERVRTEGWVDHRGRAVPVIRGNTPSPGEGPEQWRRAALEGGDFILRQVRRDGRFHYVFDPLEGRPRNRSYSLPRHAGTAYSLALLYGYTGEVRYRRGAEKAMDWLGERIPERCGEARGACLRSGRRARLGATALTVVGLLEYQRRTDDERYAGTARGLLEFIMGMQRPNGDFHHLYDLREERVIPEERRMYESEESALALVMGHNVLGDQEYLDAAERALDYLTGPKYESFFLGRFSYGADHWTCIAAEEAFPRLDHRRYLDFCRGYAEFMRRIQFRPGEGHNQDYAGHYGLGSMVVPAASAAAGFTEAGVSTYVLSRYHGAPDPALRQQVAASLDALVREQIRPDNSWLMPRAAVARGGIRQSLVEQRIRIDFTQHAASALLRGSEMDRLEPPSS